MHQYTNILRSKKEAASSEVAAQLPINKSSHLQDNRPDTAIQKKRLEGLEKKFNPLQLQKKANNTGLPNQLKSGIENLSGHSMDDVKVHYNSDKPAQLNAHAYAQGTDIHIASGQEKHLPHEAWHVVQQKQGRVKPTMQMKGKVNVNDDKGMEKEADVMGAKALSANLLQKRKNESNLTLINNSVTQLIPIDVVTLGITHLVKLNHEGSLYQRNFVDNEVAETRAGDSVVIETDNKLLSRRGPNQERNFVADEGKERTNLWTNALTHDEERLPLHTYIRNGTFVRRHVPNRIANLASGTVPETLMHAHAEDQLVTNIDSGHMAVADVIDANISPDIIKLIATLICKNPPPKFQFKKNEDPVVWLTRVMQENSKTFSTNLKALLHSNYPGAQGVLLFLEEMPANIKPLVASKVSALRDFRHGDLKTAAHHQVDVVHMVNAFGFDPVQDPSQVAHLANMLLAGGRLIITAEITGPTIKHLISGVPQEAGEAAFDSRAQAVLPTTLLGQYFNFQQLHFGNRSRVMLHNAFTARLTTRHTMPSHGGTEMEDAPTVQIILIRNANPFVASSSHVDD